MNEEQKLQAHLKDYLVEQLTEQMKVHEEFTGELEVDGLKFTYKGSHRDWNPPKGYAPPTPTVWEAWAVYLPADWRPFSCTVLGSSKEDVIERLRKHVGNIKWWNDKTDVEKDAYIKQMRS